MAVVDEEVDIEGDFEFQPSGFQQTSSVYDANELPSQTANLQPEYTHPPWMLEQGWPLDQDMDQQSRATIERMLKEEQSYSRKRGKRNRRGVSPILGLSSVEHCRDTDGVTQGSPHESIPGSCEEALLLVTTASTSVTPSISIYDTTVGLPTISFSSVTDEVEVPNYTNEVVLEDDDLSYSHVSNHVPTSTEDRRESDVPSEVDEDVEVDVDGGDPDIPSDPPDRVYKQLLLSVGEQIQETNSSNDWGVTESVKPSTRDMNNETETTEEDTCNAPISEEGEQEVTYLKDDETAVQTSSGYWVIMATPKEERHLEKEEISEQEKTIHFEFFDGRPLKTVKRYLKIRSYILEAWERCKPTYLNKTSIRSGLRNCGDVNVIGRVHCYLEQIGAINFGCHEVSYNCTDRVIYHKTNKKKPNQISLMLQHLQKGQRKRRVRDGSGAWITESELHGRTYPVTSEYNKANVSQYKKQKKDDCPFNLVPCQAFNEDQPAPFEVHISASALAIMDVHAHTSKTEVIGILGGEFQTSENTLAICSAMPCRSLSTHMQCEMDPVSLTMASEELLDQGYSVLGWYHSHPIFSPNPSLRDIETQKTFQDWFSRGGTPFVGIIVNPFGPSLQYGLSLKPSTIKCLTVLSQCTENSHEHPQSSAVPYEFDYWTIPDALDTDLVENTLSRLTSREDTIGQINMHEPFSSADGTTCLEKVLHSLRHHLVNVVGETSTENLLTFIHSAVATPSHAHQL